MRWKGLKCAGLCVLMLIGMASVGFAQEAPPPAAEPGEPPITEIGPVVEKRGLDTVLQSVNFQDADLPEVVRLLAEKSGVNVMMGKDVKGNVTCSLTDVTVRSALGALLQSNGYDMIEMAGVLIVIALEKKREVVEPAAKIVRKTFRVPYTGQEPEFLPSTGEGYTAPVRKGVGKTVDATIRGMLSPVGKMAYYDRRHIIIVEDIEQVVAMIEEFVNVLWEMPIQVFIDSSLMEVTLEEGEDFGLRWQK